MKDVAADVAKDWITLALAGLGVSFVPWNEYVGGLFLGLAGAGFAARIQPEKDRLELWVVMLGGFLAAHLSAILAHIYLPNFPVQFVMFFGGFGSRYIARFLLKALGLVEGKADQIVDRAIDRVLPGNGEGDGK